MARCDSYITGECTDGACRATNWVPDYLGNAGDWARNAPAHGLQVTLQATVGAIVVYAAGDGYSSYGHCGLVETIGADGTFLVKEMNYVLWDDYDERWSSMDDVAGFILPPGVPPGGGPPGPGGAGSGPESNVDLAWGRFAQFWNHDLPNFTNTIYAYVGALGQL